LRGSQVDFASGICEGQYRVSLARSIENHGASAAHICLNFVTCGLSSEAELTFCEHVRRANSSCFFQLRRLRQICKHVNRQVTKQLVHAFVISILDYCNSILAGLPKGLLSQLQRVQNAAARLVLGLQLRDHMKPALFELHWLPVHLRIDYKLCLLMHSATSQCCPKYISDIVQTTAASSRRERLRSSTDIHLHIQFHRPTTSLQNGRFHWLVHQSGTLCQETSGTLQTFLLSSVISILTFLTSILILSCTFVFTLQ